VPRSKENVYDAIIIGAGIGGLVCGCYLAKAGMKVLIAEQHHKPGGYCTSFKRKGFSFDAAAHSFGGYREGGRVQRVVSELGVVEKLNIRRSEISDVIISPDYRVSFFADPEKTLLGLQETFPAERDALSAFFSFLNSSHPLSFASIKSWTFKKLLDEFLHDEKLKSVLSFPVLGNGGLPPSKMSAFIGAKIFFEFLLDGGYYPEGGMQALSDAFAGRFEEFGGNLMLSNAVCNIKLQNDKVAGVILQNGENISARYLIADCDTRHVFFDLIGEQYLNSDTVDRIENADISSSMFILYLGLDEAFDKILSPGVNMWFLADYDLDRTYESILSCDFERFGRFMIRANPDGKSLMALINVAFKDRAFWQANKDRFASSFLTAIEEFIPGLKRHIVLKEAASPQTLWKFTRNNSGASYGWAATPEQVGDPEFRRPGFPKNLLFTGHWAMQGLGIPSVVYLGMDTAAYILKRSKFAPNSANIVNYE
jgi:phytoene dehydrogenase-like protein